MGLFCARSVTIRSINEKTMVSDTLKTRIIISHMVVIIMVSLSIAIAGFYFIKKDIIDRAQEKVKSDLNAAREVYAQETKNIENIIRLSVLRSEFRVLQKQAGQFDTQALETAGKILNDIRLTEGLDILTLTDDEGNVIIRSRNPGVVGDNQAKNEIIAKVLADKEIVSGTQIINKDQLLKENNDLARQAHMLVKRTEKAKPTAESERTCGLIIKAAAPVFDYDNNFIGVLYGGNLLNRNYDIVDKVKNVVYKDLEYKGKDTGTVTIFQGDMRISTNVKDKNGNRAIGTRVSAEVFDRVLGKGLPWNDRAFVVNDWYKTAYEPIRNISGDTVGMLYVGTLERPFSDLFINITLIFMVIIIAATLLAIFMSIILADRIARPLTEIADAASKLSTGNLGVKVQSSTNLLELNLLSESFNEMSAKLSEREQNLKNLNKNYVDLIGFVAHELRGMLASAVMNAYSVRDGYLGLINFKQRKAVDSVTRNLDYLTAVVGKFLNLGRIERDQLNVHKSAINLSDEIFAPSISTLMPLAERKGIKVVNNLAAGLKINADMDLMQIVANNLIGNAIKYGQENGSVIVSSHNLNGKVEIDVYNDSQPITAEQKDKLFHRFSRLETSETKKVKGTGLGLYITKQIIQQHGGNIRVEPREKGNSFIVQIEKGL